MRMVRVVAGRTRPSWHGLTGTARRQPAPGPEPGVEERMDVRRGAGWEASFAKPWTERALGLQFDERPAALLVGEATSPC